MCMCVYVFLLLILLFGINKTDGMLIPSIPACSTVYFLIFNKGKLKGQILGEFVYIRFVCVGVRRFD